MEFNGSRWLEAHLEKNAGLKTLPRNQILADIFGDGDFRLVLVDVDFGKNQEEMKANLKIYKGTGIVANQLLPKLPSCLISFYNDLTEPFLPVIGLACESDFLIYKNNKPFYKYSVPSIPLNPVEIEVWQQLLSKIEQESEYKTLIEKLQTVPYSSLSLRSQKLLFCPFENMKEEIENHSNYEPKINSTITCLSTLKKNSEDDIAISCPVIGTENGLIFILNPSSFTVLHEATLTKNMKSSSPFILQNSGLYDVDFRLIIICRENHVCLLKKGWIEGKILFKVASSIIDAVLNPIDNTLVVAMTDKNLSCFSKKGNKLWTVKTIQEITCLTYIPLKFSNVYLVGVGMRKGAIHLYQGRNVVDCISAPDTPSALIFGQMGQEEHVLIILTLVGALNFKILKRTANFSLASQEALAPIIDNKPFILPKKSKLFVEQSLREKQNAIEIHQRFQQDLIKMRLTAARALIKIQPDENVTGNQKENIKLSARVLGIGPKFNLILNVENMSDHKPLAKLSAVFHTKTSMYKLSFYYVMIPLIPPGMTFKIETKITEINEPCSTEDHNKNIIRVFIVKKDEEKPVATAIINMPESEFYDI